MPCGGGSGQEKLGPAAVAVSLASRSATAWLPRLLVEFYAPGQAGSDGSSQPFNDFSIKHVLGRKV
jgi:hypothetical protein